MKLPWSREHDAYWDFFVNHPPADPGNQINNALRAWPEGSVFPVKRDVHSPDVMTAHIKELARFFGAHLTGVAGLPAGSDYPFGVVCAFRAKYDPRRALGHGGQAPIQDGLFVTFNLSAVIREMGYRATTKLPADAERFAAAAGLGGRDPAGRLVTRGFGRQLYVADVIHTDLPLAADGELRA